MLSEGTQLLGGTLADKHGGKVVMAYGIIAFSAMSSLMPLAVSQVSMSFSAEQNVANPGEFAAKQR